VGRLVMLRRALVMRRYRGESGGESCGEGVRSGEVDSHGVRQGDATLTIVVCNMIKITCPCLY